MEENYLGLEKIGLSNVGDVYRNLNAEDLVDHILDNKEGRIGLRGAAMVDTGIYTGRSPDDKYIVDEITSNDKIWWGPVNRNCLLYTSPSPRDRTRSRMPSSA